MCIGSSCDFDRSIRYATPKLVLRFADMVKKLGPQERLVNFFEAICTVQGRAVKANQEMVCSMLNRVQRNVLENPTVLSRLQIQTENEFRGLRAVCSFVFAFSPFLIFDFVHTAHSPTHRCSASLGCAKRCATRSTSLCSRCHGPPKPKPAEALTKNTPRTARRGIWELWWAVRESIRIWCPCNFIVFAGDDA